MEQYYMQVSTDRLVRMKTVEYNLLLYPIVPLQHHYGAIPPQPHPGAMHMQGQFIPYGAPPAPHPVMMAMPIPPYSYPPGGAPHPATLPPGPPPPGGPGPGQPPLAHGFGMYHIPEYTPPGNR